MRVAPLVERTPAADLWGGIKAPRRLKACPLALTSILRGFVPEFWVGEACYYRARLMTGDPSCARINPLPSPQAHGTGDS